MIENLINFILYEKMSMFYLNTKHLAKTRFLSTSLSKQDDFNIGYLKNRKKIKYTSISPIFQQFLIKEKLNEIRIND